MRRLRKHAHKDIATAAASVVAAWKQTVTNQIRPPAKPSVETSGAPDSSVAVPPRESAPAARPDPCRAGEPGGRCGPPKFSHPPPLSNQQRHKIRETMGQALLSAVEGDDEGM